MAVLLPEGKQSFTTSAGLPLVGGRVSTFDAGTSTPRQTWSDANQTAPNANPVILDGRGEASIFWNGAYKVVLADAAGVTIWTQDNVSSTSGAIIATTITASGAAALAGTLAVTGAVTFAGAVTAAGLVTANGGATVATNTTITSATTTLGAPMLTLANSAASGFAVIDMMIAGVLRGRVRADASGNLVSVANGGQHLWYIGNEGPNVMGVSTSGFIVNGTVTDATGNVRGIPSADRIGAYTLVASDRFRRLRATGAVTVPNAVSAVDDIVQIYNNSAVAISIIQGAGLTLRQSGTVNTGNRTLAAYGTAVVTFDSASVAIASGAGLT